MSQFKRVIAWFMVFVMLIVQTACAPAPGTVGEILSQSSAGRLTEAGAEFIEIPATPALNLRFILEPAPSQAAPLVLAAQGGGSISFVFDATVGAYISLSPEIVAPFSRVALPQGTRGLVIRDGDGVEIRWVGETTPRIFAPGTGTQDVVIFDVVLALAYTFPGIEIPEAALEFANNLLGTSVQVGQLTREVSLEAFASITETPTKPTSRVGITDVAVLLAGTFNLRTRSEIAAFVRGLLGLTEAQFNESNVLLVPGVDMLPGEGGARVCIPVPDRLSAEPGQGVVVSGVPLSLGDQLIGRVISESFTTDLVVSRVDGDFVSLLAPLVSLEQNSGVRQATIEISSETGVRCPSFELGILPLAPAPGSSQKLVSELEAIVTQITRSTTQSLGTSPEVINEILDGNTDGKSELEIALAFFSFFFSSKNENSLSKLFDGTAPVLSEISFDAEQIDSEVFDSVVANSEILELLNDLGSELSFSDDVATPVPSEGRIIPVPDRVRTAEDLDRLMRLRDTYLSRDTQRIVAGINGLLAKLSTFALNFPPLAAKLSAIFTAVAILNELQAMINSFFPNTLDATLIIDTTTSANISEGEQGNWTAQVLARNDPYSLNLFTLINLATIALPAFLRDRVKQSVELTLGQILTAFSGLVFAGFGGTFSGNIIDTEPVEFGPIDVSSAEFTSVEGSDAITANHNSYTGIEKGTGVLFVETRADKFPGSPQASASVVFNVDGEDNCKDNPSSCSSSPTFGDPHIVTFDGLANSFQAVGEFIHTKDGSGSFEVQTRFRAQGTRVSLTDAVAMRIGTDRVGLYSRLPQPLLINGTPAQITGGALALPGGGRILQSGSQYEFLWPSGELVTARVIPIAGGHLSVTAAVPLARQGQYRGLLGDADGNRENDFQTQQGQILATDPSFDERYGLFGNSWRITQAESLFDYGLGETTETFTDLNFPSQQITSASFSSTVRSTAEATCRAARITDPVFLEACIVDVAETGENGFAGVSADAQQTVSPTPTDFTIEWVGGSGNWDDPANWSLNRVPNETDRARIAVPANVVITFGSGSRTVESLVVEGGGFNISGGTLTVTGTSVFGGNLQLTGGNLTTRGNSRVNGAFQSTDGTVTAIGSGASFEPTGTVILTGGSYIAREGARIAFPASATQYQPNDSTFEARDPGSILDLSSLTSINDQGFRFRSLNIFARNGGSVDLSQVTQITNTGTLNGTDISSDGLGSNINLSALQNFVGQERGASLSTTNGGNVQVPQLASLTGVSLTINSTGGVISTSQIQSLRFSRLTINGRSTDLGSLTDITGSDVLVSGGVTQTIPAAITTYFPSGTTFEADGTGSILSFLGLASIDDQGFRFASLNIFARNGGVIDLSQLAQITNTGTLNNTIINAIGTGSRIDLSGLTSFTNIAFTAGTSELRVSSSGTIQAPNLNNRVGVAVINDGGTIVLP